MTTLNPLVVWITSYGKFLKRWKHQTTFFLLRNLFAGQEATVRAGHRTTDWFHIGKGVGQVCMLSPAYLTYMQSTSCDASLDEAQLELRLPGEISITSDMQMTPLLWQKAKRN